MTPVAELLLRAKKAIENGDASMRDAAEAISAAQRHGATQREIAHAVGKSVAWVNRLCQWARNDYRDETPFGPQGKAARQRAKSVHPAEQRSRQSRSPAEELDDLAASVEAGAAQAAAIKAVAEADRAKADAAKALADAQRAKADAQKARAEAEKARFDAQTAKANERAKANFRESFSSPKGIKHVDERSRDLLVKMLGMLGSNQEGERTAAATKAEKLRCQLGLTWDELIIPAGQAARAAA